MLDEDCILELTPFGAEEYLSKLVRRHAKVLDQSRRLILNKDPEAELRFHFQAAMERIRTYSELGRAIFREDVRLGKIIQDKYETHVKCLSTAESACRAILATEYSRN